MGWYKRRGGDRERGWGRERERERKEQGVGTVVILLCLCVVNAADNKQRDPRMSAIKITIDP